MRSPVPAARSLSVGSGFDVASSASGLRPASAFVFIVAVLLAAAAKALHIAVYAGGSQPDSFKEEAAPRTSFDVVDRAGIPLAVSVECFDLSMSPQAMWRSHTPRYMAERIAAVLGDTSADELLERMLPRDPGLASPGSGPAGDGAGLYLVEQPRALRLDRHAAERVRDWIASGPYPGFWLAHDSGAEHWTLAWDPELVLSKDVRLAHQPDNERRPERWTRFLLDGLVQAIGEPTLRALEPERFARRTGQELRAALHDMLWDELMPVRYRVVSSKIDPRIAHRLTELLAEEAVSGWQMRLQERLDRRYPVRRYPQAWDEGGADAVDPFSILGAWGVLQPDAAERLARMDLADLESARAWELDQRQAFLEERFLAYQAERRPRSGLELCAERELRQPYWAGLLEAGARVYGRRVRHLPRDCRQRWDGRVPDYYERAVDAPEDPRVVSTLDASLQLFVHAELEATLEEQAAALAMAIVVDVQSGDVLAVDGVSAYETSGFAPIRHAFTPGSTLKAVIMAAALDAGYVEPYESFATHSPEGLVVRDGHSARRIHEALGAPEESSVSAEVGLARSVNAVLVQIGLRVPAALLHQRLTQLGYGVAPGSGLGPEAPGRVPPLESGRWSRCYTHASISFGHEISVSLWQHAAALATIARGGTFRPLRLIEGMEQHGQRWELPLPEEGYERVFSERACEVVRDMMASGAQWGTGRFVASPEVCPEFAYLGTKTGTTEKVERERCLHVELAHDVEHARNGTPCSRACRTALIGQRVHRNGRRTCYTSSMWAVGRLAGTPGGSLAPEPSPDRGPGRGPGYGLDQGPRELMVLVVVDDPSAKAKYGSDVSGPAAMRILRRASGLDDTPPPVEGLATLGPDAFNALDAPWAGGQE